MYIVSKKLKLKKKHQNEKSATKLKLKKVINTFKQRAFGVIYYILNRLLKKFLTSSLLSDNLHNLSF